MSELDQESIVNFSSKVRKLEDRRGSETTETNAKHDLGNQYSKGGSLIGGQKPTSNRQHKENTASGELARPSVEAISLNNHRIPLHNSQTCAPKNPSYLNSLHSGFEFYRGYSAERWPELAVTIEHFDSVTTSRNGNRGRTTYSDDQVAALECAFASNPYPTPQARQNLAQTVNVPEGKVKIWFQNRRAREKKQRTNSNNWKAVASRRPCGTSSVYIGHKTYQSCNNNNNNPPPGNISSPPLPTTWSKNDFANVSVPPSSLSLSCLSLNVADTYQNNYKNYTSQLSNEKSFPGNKSLESSKGNLQYNTWEEQSANAGTYKVMATFHHSNQSDLIPDRFPVISSAHSLLRNNVPYYEEGVPTLNAFDSAFGTNRVSSTEVKLPSDFQTRCNIDTEAIFTQSHLFNQQTAMHHDSKLSFHTEAQNNNFISNRPTATSCASSTRGHSNPSEYLLSPPPIRRFVYPFKSLLDNVKNMSDSVDYNIANNMVLNATPSLNTQTELYKSRNYLSGNSQSGEHVQPEEIASRADLVKKSQQHLLAQYKLNQHAPELGGNVINGQAGILGQYCDNGDIRLQQSTYLADLDKNEKSREYILPNYSAPYLMEGGQRQDCNKRNQSANVWPVGGKTSESIKHHSNTSIVN